MSLSTPPSPPSGDSSTVATWFMVACGLEITVEFFMFSAVVRGACLLGFPPNNLWKIRKDKNRSFQCSKKKRNKAKDTISIFFLQSTTMNFWDDTDLRGEKVTEYWEFLSWNDNRLSLFGLLIDFAPI